ncbi:hypothetical protein G6F32_016652 [Rhizopus arrhizus]|nr:hypothetical protein G6F32_016652 [Rhizopus arrhizus]
METENTMHRLLIVDDDNDIRTLLAEQLGRAARGPDRARPQPATRRWPDPVPRPARALEHPGDHAHRACRADRPRAGPGNGRR